MARKDRGPAASSRGYSARTNSKTKAEHFRVEVKQDPDGSLVNVLNKDGGTEGSRTAQRILTLLHEQLK